MGLFKSKEERRIERDIQVRQGVAQIRKQIKDLERNEKEFLDKARRARRIGSGEQLAFLKKAIRQTIAQRMGMERQLLAIETAAQVKNQAESFAAFAKSMNAVSRSISEVFGAVDMAKTQHDFESAMTKAHTLEERMNVFLDMTSDTVMSGMAEDQEVISDEELDRLLESEQAKPEMDADVARELERIERELDGK
jgi:hypothetical protein